MAKKKPRPRPRSRHGGGEGWNWLFPWPRPALPPAKAKPSALDRAITTIVTWFRMDGKRYRTTTRHRGRRRISRVHPHRYRRREYRRPL